MNKFKRGFWIFYFIAVTLGILVLSLIPEMPSPGGWLDFPGKDKLFHGIAYLALGWGLFALFGSLRSRGRLLFCFLAGGVYGGLIEILQRYAGRTPDLLDWLADGIGVAVGLTTGWIYLWFRSRLRARRAASLRKAGPSEV